MLTSAYVPSSHKEKINAIEIGVFGSDKNSVELFTRQNIGQTLIVLSMQAKYRSTV